MEGWRLADAALHNREVTAPIQDAGPKDRVGTICLLLRDGRLIGPFTSRNAARLWGQSQDLPLFSTYDLIPVQDAEKDR